MNGYHFRSSVRAYLGCTCCIAKVSFVSWHVVNVAPVAFNESPNIKVVPGMVKLPEEITPPLVMVKFPAVLVIKPFVATSAAVKVKFALPEMIPSVA